MIKRITITGQALALALLVASSVCGQTNARRERSGNGAPSGACTVSTGYADTYLDAATGDHYNCKSADGNPTIAGTWVKNGIGGGGTGDVSGPSASSDGEMVLFSGATGKALKRSNSLSGIPKLAAGVVSAAVAGNDYVAPSTTVNNHALSSNVDITGDSTIWTAANTFQRTAIGSTSTDATILQNTTAATASVQQLSPRLRFRGQGWNGSALASRSTDWIVENQPILNGSGDPTTRLVFSSSVNGGAYTSRFYLDSGITSGVGLPLLAGGGSRFLQVDNTGALVTATSPVTSINGDATAAQVISATDASLTKTDSGATHSFGLPYTLYVATVTQSSTSAPVATVRTNTTGTTFTWARTSAGVYTITAGSAILVADKTGLLVGPPNTTNNTAQGGMNAINAVRTSTTVISLNTMFMNPDSALQAPLDGRLTETLVEIRIYP